MDTQYIKVDEKHIDQKVMETAGKILKEGGLVAFPTETVYGLGGDALQKESSKKIYAAKGRPSDNPLIIHICQFDDINRIVKDVPPIAHKLAKAFWPGPLTIILQKSDEVPYETTGGLDTVAIRFPENKIALALIKAAGGYIAAPSANTSGRPSPTLAEHVRDDLDGKIEMILDGGAVGIGLESTIVDLTEGKPVILRPGYITKEMLEIALKEDVDIDKTLITPDSKQVPKAPGMKYRHYAPKGELSIISGDPDKVKQKMISCILSMKEKGEKVGVICTDETKGDYPADVVYSVGARNDEKAIAKHLFAILRAFDKENVTVIYSEEFSDKGIGKAIMNRLLKAAGHHIIEAK